MSELKLLSKWRKVLMGFAALWILGFHKWIVMSPQTSNLYQVEMFIKRIGFCGVDIFLLLSGMGLTYAIHKKGLLSFYWNRIKRVMIPFVIVGILFGTIDQWGFVKILKNLTGYNFYRVSIYSFLWFVPAIMTLYLFFPLYYRFFERAKSKAVFLFCTLEIWFLLTMIVKDILRIDMFGFTNRIPIFVIGVYLGWLTQNKRQKISRGMWFGFVIMLVLGLFLAYQANFKGLQLVVPVSNCCLPNILMSISLCFLFSGFCEWLEKFRNTRWLSIGISKFFGLFGMMSLEFYCVQEWLGNRYLPQMAQQFGYGLANLLFLIFVTICGLILHFITVGFIRLFSLIEQN